MNPELWKLLTTNNNCIVTTSNRVNKLTKQVDHLKSELCLVNRRFTKNILGDGSSGPTDGQEGGIPQRPCPANGDEWVDPITGARFIFQDCVWHAAPCCIQFTGPANVDQVTVFDEGVELPFRLVAAPLGETGKFVWCQTGAAGEIGEWVNEDMFDAANFIGVGPTGTPPPAIQLNGMTRPPIDGDEWYNETTGESFVYRLGIWVPTPCCMSVTGPTGVDIVTLFIHGTEVAEVIAPPGETGKFIWCQTGAAGEIGEWVPSTNFDAANFVGTGPSGVPLAATQLNGMTRAPIDGDEWDKIIIDGITPTRSISYIYQNGIWIEVPCCVGYESPSVFGNNIAILYFGDSVTHNIVEPPTTTGTYVWSQNGPLLTDGGWMPSTNFDAANFIGSTGVTAGTVPPPDLQLDGMTRPPIDGDQWYNIISQDFVTTRSVNYIYQNGGWTGVPCCVGYSNLQTVLVPQVDLGELYLDDGNLPTVRFVQQPLQTGTFVWYENILSFGPGWTAASNFDAANFIGFGGTGLTAGSLPPGPLDGMTRSPIDGDQWYNIIDSGLATERSQSFIYKAGAWVEAPCCAAFVDLPSNDVGTLYMEDTSTNNVVQPPEDATGAFLWTQNSTGTTNNDSNGVWTPVTSPFVSLINTGTVYPIGLTGPLPISLFGSTGAHAIPFTEFSDTDGLFNGSDTITIDDPGQYAISANILSFAQINGGATSGGPSSIYTLFAALYINDLVNDQAQFYATATPIFVPLFLQNINLSYIVILNTNDTLKLGYFDTLSGSATGTNNILASWQVKKFIQP